MYRHEYLTSESAERKHKMILNWANDDTQGSLYNTIHT